MAKKSASKGYGWGIDSVTQCRDGGGVEKLQIKGTAMSLKGFGHPRNSYYGPVPAGQVDPVAIDTSTGAMLAEAATSCLTAGVWCVEIDLASGYVTYEDILHPDTGVKIGDMIVVNMLLWHYYENVNEIHVLVERGRFKEPLQPGHTNVCTPCTCP